MRKARDARAARRAQGTCGARAVCDAPNTATGGATDSDPAADGTVTSAQDDVAPDGNLVYPAEGSSSQADGARPHYTPDTPA